ncbi:MAG: hypothetical protein AMJ92_01450 [candidate division Zixibacteria bacterium SM23_81]|nr:MAG: hypothetical protein AMJ92_01450 [candidate division Zixibacteria bacterium SM23_81]
MTQFWKKVKEALQEGAEAMREGATTVAEKTQEAINIGNLKLQIHNLNRTTEGHFTELGGRVYHLIQEKAPRVYRDLEVKKLIEKVKGLEEKIEGAEKEIERLQGKELEKEKQAETRPRGEKGG